MSTVCTMGSLGTHRRVRSRRILVACLIACAGVVLAWKAITLLNWNPRYEIGQERDRLNGVAVYHNGGVDHSSGRHLSPDGYNLGIKYQCVEFVKRYYYQRLNHTMPDSYGHAKQFFDPTVADGAINTRRNLRQYRNGSESKPRADDLIVLGPSWLNRYGHVAIVSAVSDSELEIVQQNPGPFGSSRERLSLVYQGGGWQCRNERVLGWLRKDPNQAGQSTVPQPSHQ